MDVGLGVLWRLKLDDEIDTEDIKASGSHVSSNNTLEPSLLESIDGRLSRVLRDVSVHDFVVDFKSVSIAKLICVFLCRSKDQDLTCRSSVDVDC